MQSIEMLSPYLVIDLAPSDELVEPRVVVLVDAEGVQEVVVGQVGDVGEAGQQKGPGVEDVAEEEGQELPARPAQKEVGQGLGTRARTDRGLDCGGKCLTPCTWKGRGRQFCEQVQPGPRQSSVRT